MNEITDLIKNGLAQGYSENILFTLNFSGLQSRVIEYLIVVNIAQSLKEYCYKNNIQVNLEYPINDFYNGAFPSFKFVGDDPFNITMLSRAEHAPEDSISKRIDIVLTKDPKIEGAHSTKIQSYIGIEVKAVNRPDSLIKVDIRRLADGMSLKDNIHESSINCCYVCFFRRLDNDTSIISVEEIEKGIQIEKDKWLKYFNQLKPTYQNLDFELMDLNVINSPVDEIIFEEDETGNDIDAGLLREMTGHVNAYIIKIARIS